MENPSGIQSGSYIPVVQDFFAQFYSFSTQISSGFAYHMYTLFLFTKSDIKTTLIPVSFLAIASSPGPLLVHEPETFFWVWLHILKYNLSS
ncbi:hypothetical protein M422DRAFT_257072 [Sphaerobolus stellatus SS14]|uniref:Unplaced genomic scaffold SPHSTscaffold_72, whole genome shotgun sequence n=1 Tax=Sphaerobolus stellatus (strain SS14) TaxID=990650 RepID=A0A0C9VPE4_SPHS4|nr:hypothetical protein M422DRAFT_257072 [Sphaerobolus stellatus SS14]